MMLKYLLFRSSIFVLYECITFVKKKYYNRKSNTDSFKYKQVLTETELVKISLKNYIGILTPVYNLIILFVMIYFAVRPYEKLVLLAEEQGKIILIKEKI